MSSTDTDSTADSIGFGGRHWHSLRSRLYTGPGLPTYQTFIDQLQDLDTGILTPGMICPICRIPFSESQAVSGNAGSEHQHVLALEALPFHVEDNRTHSDRPVRLPCAFRHIVGKACIMSWATEGGGTTCPLDREELFTVGTGDWFTVADDTDRFDSGLRDIEKMPIRRLLQRFRTATETDIVTVNARSMTKRLATLLFRIVFETHGIPESATLRWKWPRIRRPLYGYNEATAFYAVVKHFLKSEPLPDSGKYPRHIITLLNPALPHVFAVLYRLARFFQAKSMPLAALACAMQEHLAEFFVNFAFLITDGNVLESIAFKTIDIWTTQELLVTQLRTATNQPNEWDDIVGPRDPEIERSGPVRPYFGLGGMDWIGYSFALRWREGGESGLPLTLGAAAETLVYDRDNYLPLSERGRGSYGGGRAGSADSRVSPGTREYGRSRSPSPRLWSSNPSVRSNTSRRRGSSVSPAPGRSSAPVLSSPRRRNDLELLRLESMPSSPNLSVRPWSPLSDESGEELLAPTSGTIALARLRMRRFRERS
ncbi:hypothetical protein P171DRAFT_524121 [Karstenula rhodostoma CBS 690.94]|uniref:Uncharacterized protein n=1 Tax=Karstenula rhodostoma CBS 690.94 TaxID=1392251 RepID=A0A9P4U8R1_9PLEO|nr:hypothetical protein P171DRAFT_524121 [Karstenula rhodostoma CBS 690.94]